MPAADPDTAEQQLRRVIEALERDLGRIRTGAASASLIESVSVDHGGRRARLIDIATVTIPDPRQIVIRPWEPASLRAIGTAISHSRIGLTPTIDGSTIRLYVPALSEERRLELVGIIHRRTEQARVEIRAIRHEAQSALRAQERRHAIGTDDARREAARLQQLTDRFVAEADRLGHAREASVLRL